MTTYTFTTRGHTFRIHHDELGFLVTDDTLAFIAEDLTTALNEIENRVDATEKPAYDFRGDPR